jgi:polar amino acid transport system substrate-binding protein
MRFVARLFALFSLTLLLNAPAAFARSFEQIQKEKTITVATEGQFAPFNFFQGSKLTGFEVELADEIFKRLGIHVDWKVINFETLLTGLQQDRWDFVIASHAITPEREKVVLFASPHYCTGSVIITSDPAIHGVADLKGKTVAVATGTTSYDWVKANVPEVKDVKNFPQDPDARAAAQTGRADAWVTDRITATASLKTNSQGDLKILPDLLYRERVAAVAAKGNEPLVDQWNKTLSALIADGTYDKLSHKWLGADYACH